jgi:hypothetical protein
MILKILLKSYLIFEIAAIEVNDWGRVYQNDKIKADHLPSSCLVQHWCK